MITDKTIYQDDDLIFWRVCNRTSSGHYLISECDRQGKLFDSSICELVPLSEIQDFDIVGKVN